MPGNSHVQMVLSQTLFFSLWFLLRQVLWPPPFTSSKPNTWWPWFLLPFPLPSRSSNSPICETLGLGTLFVLFAPKFPVPQQCPTHNSHLLNIFFCVRMAHYCCSMTVDCMGGHCFVLSSCTRPQRAKNQCEVTHGECHIIKQKL
jgi:hypothetical protein